MTVRWSAKGVTKNSRPLIRPTQEILTRRFKRGMKNVHNGNRHQKDGAKVQHFWKTTGRLLTYLKPWKLGVIISILS